MQPHRTETFKLSPDPLLIDKVRDIVGLYLNPPQHAAVFCVDEKPQIQALDRTAPLLPLRPGEAERRTHDYKRHGTSLFAALEVKTGQVLGQIRRTVRHVEEGASVIDILSSALDDFRTSYLLTYTAQGVAPGGWHDLRVELVGGPSYSVRARRGYDGG